MRCMQGEERHICESGICCIVGGQDMPLATSVLCIVLAPCVIELWENASTIMPRMKARSSDFTTCNCYL